MAETNRQSLKDLEAGVRAHSGAHVEVLVHARGEGVDVLATRELLGLHRAGEWRTWGWHEVAGGGWRAEDNRLRWKTTQGEEWEAVLSDVGRLPELFRERIQASTMMSEAHDVSGGRVQIIARRALDGSGRVKWYALASGGASLADEETARFVVERTDQLKADLAL